MTKSSGQMPSSLEDDPLDGMTPFQKVLYRSKQQPLVPLGCLGTTIAVILAAKGVRTGDSRSAQKWFRWRVGLQGLTLVALLFGSYYYADNYKKANEDPRRIEHRKG
ncbi:hypothetical protein HII13_003028 [Brettanomyces bruxellensis]|nr:hypothetical protein HII13_003028 [Brettanomyces bruxellensis]